VLLLLSITNFVFASPLFLVVKLIPVLLFAPDPIRSTLLLVTIPKVLDYDGALASHQPLAQLSHPGEALRALLHALSSDPANVVVVVTGRRRADVEDWCVSECSWFFFFDYVLVLYWAYSFTLGRLVSKFLQP